MKRRCEDETRRGGTFFWIARAGLLAATLVPVGCQSGKTTPPQAGEVPYSGDNASNVQEALDQIQAHLTQLDQTVADLSEQIAALKGTRQPVPTGPTDARDVRWRTANGEKLDVATALENTTAQIADLAAQVSTLATTVSDLGDSISTLQTHHECPQGAIRLGKATAGVCMDVEASEPADDSSAEALCLNKGGRLCTYAELEAFWTLITWPPDLPDDDPDHGKAEWIGDMQNTYDADNDAYLEVTLYHSWDRKGTGNYNLDGGGIPNLPYRCCYDR